METEFFDATRSPPVSTKPKDSNSEVTVLRSDTELQLIAVY